MAIAVNTTIPTDKDIRFLVQNKAEPRSLFVFDYKQKQTRCFLFILMIYFTEHAFNWQLSLTNKYDFVFLYFSSKILLSFTYDHLSKQKTTTTACYSSFLFERKQIDMSVGLLILFSFFFVLNEPHALTTLIVLFYYYFSIDTQTR